MAISLRWGAATDTGRVRSVNEDSALVEDGLFAVADGMGGHVAGEVASRVAIEALRINAREGLVEAVQLANRAVFDRASGDSSLRGMGTTMCAVALVDHDGRPQLLIANVGDSRVYLFRDGELVQLTDDHSLVADLERDGRITSEEAKVHPQRNIVTRVLGNEPEVEVDEFWLDPFRGDRVLLCSDGLFDMVDDPVIVGVLRNQADANEAAEELVALANDAGGRDNITAVLVDVVDDGGKAEEASASLAGTTIVSRPVERVVADHDLPEPVGSRVPPPPRPRSRHLTWRSALFMIALLVVVLGAAGGTWWFARSSYFVGLDRGRVTLFRGRPEGLLFLDPTVEERTRMRLDDLPPARRAAVEDQHLFTTKAAAKRFIGRLRQETTTTTTTTTPPSTSSTIVLPPTSAPTATSTP